MSPLDHLRLWFVGLPRDVQYEVAFLLAGAVLDDFRGRSFRSERDFIAAIEAWLAPTPFAARTVGKALGFVAALEHLVAKNFEAETWATSRARLEERLNGFAIKGDAHMVREIEGLLAGLPEQETMWAELRQGWLRLKAEHLSNDAVELWSREQGSARVRAA